MGDLANRIRKRHKHLRRWARRRGVSCFRLYDRDIPECPAIVDWYDGDAVAWALPRRRDEVEGVSPAWREEIVAEVAEGLGLGPDRIHLKVRERQRPGRGYGRLSRESVIRVVEEFGLRFEVNLSDYLDTGLFLDHRDLRQRVGERCAGQRVLNLFAYTGAFTCHAAVGAARATTTVDLSATYLDWAARNLRLNGHEAGGPHALVQQDTLAYLEDARARGDRHDLIVCDPPTFSNSKRMRESSFAVERDHPDLIRACLDLLDPGGLLIFSTNARRFRLETPALPTDLEIEDWTRETMPRDFEGSRIHQVWALQRRAG